MKDLDKMMKECMKPHALLHLVTGAGLGMLLTTWFTAVAVNAAMWGWVLLLVGIVGDYLVQSKK